MHHHHPRFYQYGGPPSIVMGTWGERSRSQFAPPPAPFAIPPAGVPGGRLGPAPNRITAGYHSLQYVAPPPNPAEFTTPTKHHAPNSSEKHRKHSSSSSKSSKKDKHRDHHHEQLHNLPQVQAKKIIITIYIGHHKRGD